MVRGGRWKALRVHRRGVGQGQAAPPFLAGAGRSVGLARAGPWREASAGILSEPHSIERARAALQAKYGWQMRLADLLSGLTGRINRRAWLEIQL